MSEPERAERTPLRRIDRSIARVTKIHELERLQYRLRRLCDYHEDRFTHAENEAEATDAWFPYADAMEALGIVDLLLLDGTVRPGDDGAPTNEGGQQ